MELSKQFSTNIQSAYGDEGLQWLRELPHIVETLTNKWALSDVTPVVNLSFHYVAKAKRNGESVVLKLGPPTSPIPREVRWLQHFPQVTPAVFLFDEATKSFLMEQCNSGLSLKEELFLNENDEAATRVLAQSIRNLQKEKVLDSTYKHLSELIPDLNSLDGIADAKMLSKAKTLFTELTSDRSEDILLHGDLHHDNILKHNDTWKIIDPHGYVGDPVSEVGVMIYNPLELLSKEKLGAICQKRMAILSEELQFDYKRVQSWCFCKTMLSAAWNAADFPDLMKHELHLASLI